MQFLGCAKNTNGDSDSSVVNPEDEEVFSIEAFGIVKATRERTIAIEFPATIEKIHATSGQRVTIGTVLITLNIGPYQGQQGALKSKVKIAQLRLDQYQSDYARSDASASSDYRRLENSVASAQREIDQLTQERYELDLRIGRGTEPEMNKLEVDLEQAQKELLAAENDLDLRNTLYKDGSVAEKELEQELHAVEALRFRVRNLTLSVESMKNRQGQELSRLRLLISQKTAEGESVPHGIALVKILDLDTLVVEAEVPEEFIKEIALDSAATITPLADPERVYTGKVTHIAGMAKSRNGETVVDVTLEVLDHDGFLIPYFNVDIEFTHRPEDRSEATDDSYTS